MKNILSVILLFTTVITQAQNHITAKVNLTNSKWTHQYNDDWKNYWFNYYTTQEDTLLNDGYTYLKIYYSESDNTIHNNNQFVGGIRFDSVSNKIFARTNQPRIKGDTIFTIILYDFNLEIGDTLLADSGYCVYHSAFVNKVDSIQTLDGLYRKRFHIGYFPEYPDYSPNLIIEGIGNIGRTFFTRLDKAITTNGEPVRTRCYKLNEQCIYMHVNVESCDKCFQYPVGIKTINQDLHAQLIYPNPVSDILYLKPQAEKIKQIAIYNINGQLVRSLNYNQLLPQNAIDVATLPKGIYQIILVAEDGGIFNNRFVKQ